ncbi:zinc ribbon domain-containing protein [Fibrobacterota bacterium]
MVNPNDYFTCPCCGAEVKEGAPACSECGADDTTGWSDKPYDMSDLPDEEYDYQESLEREFGSAKKPVMPNWVAITGFILLILLLWVFIR